MYYHDNDALKSDGADSETTEAGATSATDHLNEQPTFMPF